MSQLLGGQSQIKTNLDCSLICLRRTTSHKASCSLERSSQITRRWQPADMDLDFVVVEQALDRHDALNKEWLVVAHVKMHEALLFIQRSRMHAAGSQGADEPALPCP